MKKESSTHEANGRLLQATCGIAYTIGITGGRWKLSILAFLLANTSLRYSELRDKLPGISDRMLSTQLRELERDGLILRRVYAAVPPKVDYQLSDKGRSLENILNAMSAWGDEHYNGSMDALRSEA